VVVHSFPRLTALFGAPVQKLTAEQIGAAVAAKVPEAEDLDFKQSLYPKTTDGKQELAKDVAGLANVSGGILVLGVTDQGSAAHTSEPVPLSAAETERMQKICQHGVRPFLPGVKIIPVPLAPGEPTGYYVIIVPRSPDAPHATVRGGDNGDGTLLSYPARDGQITRYLHEAEIARYYRDRFISRAEMAAALDRIHQEGTARIGPERAWLTVSMYPTAPGTQRTVGSPTIVRIGEEVREWANATPQLPGTIFNEWTTGFPGVRRAVVTGAATYSGMLVHPFAELHFNGAGFAATPASTVVHHPPATADPWPMEIAQDILELNLLSMVLLLTRHAAGSGAGGDGEFRAQFRLAPHVSLQAVVGTPTAMYAPTETFVDEYEKVRHSIEISQNPAPARTTANLDELTEDWHAAVQTAHALAVDILGQFAVADTHVLRADGTLSHDNIDSALVSQITAWESAPARRNFLH
jgi:hypothetical protein